MPSLSVHEARTRAGSIAVTSYDVDLDLTVGDTGFRSRTVVEFDSYDRQATFVEVRPERLVSVRLNEDRIDPTALRDGRIHLDNLLDHNTLQIEAVMAYSRDGEGLHRSVDPEDGLAYVYAMSFLDAAPRIFACFDQPDLKAPYRISARVPDGWNVVGNSPTTLGDDGVWRLGPTRPLSTYFVTLVAGPYHQLAREHDGVRVVLHSRQTLAEHLDKDADELFTVTGQCLDEFHRLFGIRYPFGEYHQAFVPEFNAGAMENPGCVTFRDDLVFRAQATETERAQRANVIAHEMAHQWFGNLVTMRWWDDLWLNESFAEYMGYRVAGDVTRFTDNWLEFALRRKAWGIAADQRSSTHPVAGNGARDAQSALNDFDGISYSKGAATLRQLNAYLGDDAFLAGVVDHLRTHAYANATLADLVSSWERASGKPLGAWVDAWLRTSGVDTLSCVIDPAGRPVIDRTLGSAPATSRPHAITVTWFTGDGDSTSTPLLVDATATPVPLPYDGRGLVLPDSADETWAKVRLDDASAGEAPAVLASVDDPLARAVIWGALREAVFDAELDPERLLDVLEAALPDEPSDLVVDAMLRLAVDAVGRFLPHPDHRRRVTILAYRLMDEANPASNRQLVAARAYLRHATDVDLLRSWLAGHGPDGLLLDSDVRWRVLLSLCAAGAAGTAEIEAESAVDRSSQGRLHALACRTALPDPQAKEQAWSTITTDGSVSNYELYAVAGGFFLPGQDDLVAPYVARFFDDLPATSRIRHGWVVERSTELAYPRFSADAATVRRAEQALSRDDLASGVRRAIADRTDDLRRVIASRERFGH